MKKKSHYYEKKVGFMKEKLHYYERKVSPLQIFHNFEILSLRNTPINLSGKFSIDWN